MLCVPGLQRVRAGFWQRRTSLGQMAAVRHVLELVNPEPHELDDRITQQPTLTQCKPWRAVEGTLSLRLDRQCGPFMA